MTRSACTRFPHRYPFCDTHNIHLLRGCVQQFLRFAARHYAVLCNLPCRPLTPVVWFVFAAPADLFSPLGPPPHIPHPTRTPTHAGHLPPHPRSCTLPSPFTPPHTTALYSNVYLQCLPHCSADYRYTACHYPPIADTRDTAAAGLPSTTHTHTTHIPRIAPRGSITCPLPHTARRSTPAVLLPPPACPQFPHTAVTTLPATLHTGLPH